NGEFINTAKVTATDPNENPVENTDPEEVEADQNPKIDLTKVAQQQTYDEVGDVITYSLIATNTGNVTLDNATISDPKVTVVSCDPANDITLAPDASFSCTAVYTITQSDLDNGEFINIARVDATDPDGDPVNDTATEEVDAIQTAAIDLTKV